MALDYRHIKQQELLCINPALNQEDLEHLSAQALIDLKFAEMKKFKLGHISELYTQSTDVFQKTASVLDQEIGYLYQRQGFNSQNEFSRILYPLLDNALENHGFFTANGQSANFNILYTVKNALKDSNFSCDNEDFYYESRHIMKTLKMKTEEFREGAFNIRYVDTTFLEKDYKLTDHSKYDLVIIDTTCIDRFDTEFMNQVQALCRQTCTVLTRSHLKLDSLGAEYGLLGSIVVYNHSKVKNHIALRLRFNVWSDLPEVLDYVSSLTGSFARVEDIYPFLNRKDWNDLGSKRIKRIRSNGQMIETELKDLISDASLECETNIHKLHIKIKLPNEDFEIEKLVVKLGVLYQLPVRWCDSFGFDFISVCKYIYIGRPDLLFVRICYPDLTSDYSEKMVGFFRQLLTTLRN